MTSLHVVPDPIEVEAIAAEPLAPLLTTATFAELLGVSKNRLIQLRHEHRLPPAIRIGTSLRWDPADVAAWLRSLKEAQ